MARNRSRKDPNWISPKERRELETKNNEGYTDYTAYNAITGKDLMSKPNITNPQRKVNGSYKG